MSRYIDANLISYEQRDRLGLGIDYGTTDRSTYEIAYKSQIDKIPTADVEEVKHGKWVTITVPRHDPHGEKFLLCTNCEHMWRKELLVDVASGDFPKRCPECGAHMDAKENEK